MPGGLDPGGIALLVTIIVAAVVTVYEWWDGRPRTSVLSSGLFCLAFSAMFVVLYAVEMFGLPGSTRLVAVGLEIVFMIGAIHFLREHQSDGSATKETA